MAEKRRPRPDGKKNTRLGAQRANDINNGVRGMKKVVKGGIVKWIPIKKK